ncbi:pilus assembly FimT family protein [Pseudoxanthomonas beigongshangi]
MHLPTRHGARRRVEGFSLVEVIATTALLSLLGAMAMPSFEHLVNSNRLASTSNALVALLHTARVEGTRNGARVTVCTSADGKYCGTEAGPESGVLVTRSGKSRKAFPPEVLAFVEGRSPVSVSAGSLVSEGLRFGMDGMPPSGERAWVNQTVLRVCVPTRRPANNIRDLVLMPAGRVKVIHSDGGGQCPPVGVAAN